MFIVSNGPVEKPIRTPLRESTDAWKVIMGRMMIESGPETAGHYQVCEFNRVVQVYPVTGTGVWRWIDTTLSRAINDIRSDNYELGGHPVQRSMCPRVAIWSRDLPLIGLQRRSMEGLCLDF